MVQKNCYLFAFQDSTKHFVEFAFSLILFNLNVVINVFNNTFKLVLFGGKILNLCFISLGSGLSPGPVSSERPFAISIVICDASGIEIIIIRCKETKNDFM